MTWLRDLISYWRRQRRIARNIRLARRKMREMMWRPSK